MSIRHAIAASALAIALATGAAHAAPHPNPAIAFPQEHSQFKPDPDLVFGRLPNGMTYILQHNATPEHTASVIMRVAAGSMMETDRQKGLAHFVEHMAFQGTTNIPRGELKHILERNGFAFGADANAFTTASTTNYALSAPKSDDETVGTALFIMREIAGNMLIAPDAVESERGVILSEERVRDNPAMHRDKAFGQFLYPGLRMADYSQPIGSVDIIKSAPPAELASFYHSWYRPELATLIVIGDFDAKAVEARIKKNFSDWKAAGAMPAEPDWGTYAPKGPRVFNYAEKGLTREIDATWITPPETRPDMPARQAESLQDSILMGLMNRRYQQAIQAGTADYLGAGLFGYNNFKTSHNIGLSVTPKPGKSKEAFVQAHEMLRTFMTGGVSDAEAAIFAGSLATAHGNFEKSWPTRDNNGIAWGLVDSLDRDSVPIGLVEHLKEIDGDGALVTKDALNGRLKQLFAGDGPIFTDYGEDTSDFAPDAVTAAYTELNGHTAQAFADAAKKDWPYTSFGPEVKPVSHSVDPDFGYGHYVFPNGVVLNVLNEHYTANYVGVQVDFMGGTQAMDRAVPRPAALPLGTFVLQGGLKKISLNDAQAALAGKTANVNFAMTGRKSILNGGTVPADLLTEMQLLMAFTVDPALTPQSYTQWQAYVPEQLKTMKTDPGQMLGREMSSVLHPGDWRFDAKWLDKAPQTPWADVASIYTDALKDTPIVITIVGDMDEAAAVSAVGQTFANLPQRPADAQMAKDGNLMTFPPAQHEFAFTHEGRADQNISLELWPTHDFYADPKEAVQLTILAGVMRNRLFEALRQKDGADYTPEGFATSDGEYKGFGYIQLDATVKSGEDARFRAAVAAIAADLKAKDISADELKRVVAPMIDGLVSAKKSVGYWFQVVEDTGTQPLARDVTKAYESRLKSVTPADLRKLAQTYLRDDTAIHVVMKAAGS